MSADTPDVKIRSVEEETTNISLVPEVDEDGDGESNGEHDVVGLEVPSAREAFSVSKVSQFEESVQIPDINKHVIESKDEGISNSEVSSIAGRLQNVSMLLGIKDKEP